tara:strand:+ start:38 stop:592 length:555 start_codon:yes stop_codon:yes gene_type:complete
MVDDSKNKSAITTTTPFYVVVGIVCYFVLYLILMFDDETKVPKHDKSTYVEVEIPLNNDNAHKYKWPFRKTPDELNKKFQNKYEDDDDLWGGENKLTKFRLTFKRFENALKNKEILYVYSPQTWNKIKVLDLRRNDVRDTFIDYFAIDEYRTGNDDVKYVTTGDGIGAGDPWYLIDQKLYKHLF